MPEARGGTRHRVAVVGAGYFSQFHLRAWQALPGVELVGLCDAQPERAAEAARGFGVPRAFSRLDEMLDATAPTLLDIVSPPASHATLLPQALSHGIATICQKPFCTDYAQAREQSERFARAGVPLVVHENFRFMPWFREARRLIDTGRLGRLHGASFRLRPGDGQGPRAYLDRQPYFQQMPRLLVAETAIHLIDSFRFLLGEVADVSARLRRLNPAIQGEDAATIELGFAGDAIGLIDGNRLNEHPAANQRRTMGEMWLEGEGGVLRLDGDARLWLKPHGEPEAELAYDSGPSSEFGGGAVAALQAHVLDALERGIAPENNASDYLQNLRIQEAVYQSHRSGRRIRMSDFEPAADAHLRPVF